MTDLDPTASRRRFGSRKIILIVLAGLAIFGVALFFILQRDFIAGLASGAVKG